MRAGRGRAIGLSLLLASSWVVLAARPGTAQQVGRPEVDKQVMIFLLDRVSFEQMLATPEIRELARAGGAALMSPRTVPGDEGPGAYVTLGAGTRSVGPDARVQGYDRGEPLDGGTAEDAFRDRFPGRDLPLGPFLLDIDRYVEANEGRSIPGLLATRLLRAGRTVAVFGNADSGDGIDRPGLTVAMNDKGVGPLGAVGAVFAPRPGGGGAPLVLPIAEPKPDLLGEFRLDLDAVNLVATGGRIPNPAPWVTAHLAVFDLGDTLRIDRDASTSPAARVAREQHEALDRLSAEIKYFVGRAASHDVLAIIAAPSTSTAMDRVKDELTPIVIARGDPLDLFPESGPVDTLTSDTTRRVGLVSNEDVAPTILRFFGLFAPEEMHGQPIRFVRTAPAPFELHARHLANRRMSVPIQVAAGLYVTFFGLVGVLLIARRDRVPSWLRWPVAWIALSVPALGVALLAAGHLGTLTYGTVVPFVIVVTLAGTLLFVPLVRVGLLLPAACIGAGVLLYFLWESAQHWTAALTPFLGGSELDGGRFFGLPNVFVGLLIGSSLYVAAVLPRWVGFALVALVALFAGLPGFGANIGGAVSLFAAAGLWLALRTRGRLDWPGAAITVAVVLAGTAAVLAAHALAAEPTHGTRFVTEGGRSPFGAIAAVWDRLMVGLRLLVHNPFALVPVLGLPAMLWVLLRPPPVVAEALAGQQAWRDALLVIVIASVVAYFVNDSGPAACGLGFGLALGGLVFVTLSMRPADHPAADELSAAVAA